MLKPGHSEDHGMNPDGGDMKGMTLRNASDRDVESNLAIRMHEDTTVGKSDANRRTWFGRYLEKRYNVFMNKI